MIIQNSTTPGQAALPVRQVSDDTVKVTSPGIGSTSASSDIALKNNARHSINHSEQLKSAVIDINKAMRQSNRNLEFSVDSDTKIPMVKLVDSDTGQLIRQMPSEETLAIARSIDHFQHGLLLSHLA